MDTETINSKQEFPLMIKIKSQSSPKIKIILFKKKLLLNVLNKYPDADVVNGMN
jgi:hypothetical protein